MPTVQEEQAATSTCTVVLFGASGDLAKARSYGDVRSGEHGLLGPNYAIVASRAHR